MKPKHHTAEDHAPEQTSVTIRKFRMGQEPSPVADEAHLTPSQRISAVWPVTEAAWRLSGKPFPTEESTRSVIRVIKRPG